MQRPEHHGSRLKIWIRVISGRQRNTCPNREKKRLIWYRKTVCYFHRRTVGKVGIAGRELATNQQIVSLIFDETRVLPLYGYYALRYHAEEIRKLSNQTTMALISRKTLGQYRIYVPDSLEKQQEIVDKLRRF